jgi:activator of HSP90 ATPase
MAMSFEISDDFSASPETIYRAWLDSEAHGAMTGSPAQVSSEVDGRFEAWDGYIEGTNLELEPYLRIVQAWRTVEFAEDDPDSRLEITLEAIASGTRLTLRHTGLPGHGMQYKQGWVDNYFEPMKAYFTS